MAGRFSINQRALYIALGSALISAASFTVISSYAYLHFTGLAGRFRLPEIAWQWWVALQYRQDPRVSQWLIASALPAVVPTVALVAVLARSRYLRPWSLRRVPGPIQRALRGSANEVPPGVSTLFGDGRWAIPQETLDLFPGGDPVHGGIAVGELRPERDLMIATAGPYRSYRRRTWGTGGKARLLVDPCNEGSPHSAVISGTGGSKSVSLVASGFTWRGSSFWLDPSTELSPMLDPVRRRMGHRPYVLSPYTAHTVGFNVLDTIDITSPLAEIDCQAALEGVCGYTPRTNNATEFFKDSTKGLILAFLANMMWDPGAPPELKTLKMLRRAMAIPEDNLRRQLKLIHENSDSPLARQLAGDFVQITPETFSGIVAGAAKEMRWLSTAALADLVSGNTFRASDILNGSTDVFLALPLKVLRTTPAVGRCIIGALLHAIIEADGNITGKIAGFLDEAYQLGRQTEVEIARDGGRKYGLVLHTVWQSIRQVEQLWGKEGLEAWEEAWSWRAFSGVAANHAAEDISRNLGNKTIIKTSETHRAGWPGNGRNQPNVSYSEGSQPVISAPQIMHNLRTDARIVLPKSGWPLLMGSPIYFRRPKMARAVGHNRFAKVVARRFRGLWSRCWGSFRAFGGRSPLLDHSPERSTPSITIADSGAYDPADLEPLLEEEDWIARPLTETDVAAFVELVRKSSDSSSVAFFKAMGEALEQCLMTHMLEDPDLSPHLKTLTHLRGGLSVTKREMLEALRVIYRTSASPLAREIAGLLLDLPDETFAGIFKSLELH